MLIAQHFTIYLLFRFVALVLCCCFLEAIFCDVWNYRVMLIVKKTLVFLISVYSMVMMLLFLPFFVFGYVYESGEGHIFFEAIILIFTVLYYLMKTTMACCIFSCMRSSVVCELIYIVRQCKIVLFFAFLLITSSTVLMISLGSGYFPEFSPPWFVVSQDAILFVELMYFLSQKNKWRKISEVCHV